MTLDNVRPFFSERERQLENLELQVGNERKKFADLESNLTICQEKYEIENKNMKGTIEEKDAR